ncbi:MAG: uroporphyrinogen-III C-methyltransferase [Acidobacteria bacterium]|nr:uroporphyrinogen-III C-methyltransferase [Acidobacteriota bacterium]
MRPKVFLIGAGPGAPDLISVRGLRALQSATVVLHDSRVHPRLLAMAPPQAERIDVGRVAPEVFEQDAINFLIAEKAREGQTVARLKWGSPFLFDRGGVEALFLHEQGIVFEVIPAVPSLVAASSFAGIPLTYPGAGDTVTFLRGYESEGRQTPGIDWTSLANLGGTLVSFTSPRQLQRVVTSLISHGRPEDEPAAFVMGPSVPAQQTVVATLGDIVSAVQGHEKPVPGFLVVGTVVRFRDHLRWFDNRPLFGKRVLVTRSREQAPELVELLELNGAEAIEAPVLRILAPLDEAPIEQAVANLRSYDWVLFTSTNAVAAVLRRVLRESRDLRAIAGPSLCAVGPGTAERLHRFGIVPDLDPDDHRISGLLRALSARGSLKGARVLLPVSDAPGDSLADELRAAGALVDRIEAYRAATVEGDLHLDLYRQLLERRIDAVTFTSATTVRAFVEIHGADQSADLLSSTVVATIGPAAADAAAEAGIPVHVATTGGTIDELVYGLIHHFRS